MIGALAAGTVQDKLGRKKYANYIENIFEIHLCGLYSYCCLINLLVRALLIIDAIFIISAAETFLYAEEDLSFKVDDNSGYFLFWIGRLITGVACGMATAVIPTYLGGLSL